MINQVRHLNPFAQVGEQYMSIMEQVENHKQIIDWHCCIALWVKIGAYYAKAYPYVAKSISHANNTFQSQEPAPT